RVYSDRNRFLAPNDQTWVVPITLRNLDQPSAPPPNVLLTRKEETFTLPGCSPHLFINRDGRGLYRTAHAPAMLQVEKGLGSALTAAERVTLLSDSGTLMRLGERTIGDHMGVIESLGHERARAVVEVILGTLSNIGQNLVDDARRPRFDAWVTAYLRPLANELGWEPRPGESDEDKQLRASVLGTLGYLGNDPATLARARQLAEQALADPKAVDPSMLSTIFNLAAYSGDSAWYDRVKAQMAQAKSPQEYYRYLYSLTAFRQPELALRSLEYAISADMRNQDMPGFIGSLMGNPASRAAAWQFVKDHWGDLQKKFTTWGGAGLVASTGALCDETSREDVKHFFAAHPVAAAERGLKQALERIESCVAFRELQTQNLNAWLEKQPSAHASK
ncbi:MAG TPA: ERAP1-like C-terminal domain-containing protein, partial [Thermoanaerobaculia bacterium]|nr:ERAP1-like C-terminal domain-containing protein [Thermoanaerobaculia bacterium]